jgi:integrase
MRVNVSIGNAKRRSAKGFIVIDFRGFGFKTRHTLPTKVVAEAKQQVRSIENRCAELQKDESHDFYSWNKKEQKAFIFVGVEPKKQTSEITNLKEAVELYIKRLKAKRKARTTWKQYELELQAATKFFGDQEIKRFSASNLQDFVDFRSGKKNTQGQNRGHNPKPLTVKKHLAALKRCLKYLASTGAIEQLNLSMFDALDFGVEELKETSKLTPFCDIETRLQELEKYEISHSEEQAFSTVIYSSKQLKELLDYLEAKLFQDGTVSSTRIFAAIYLACVTGCRRSELTRIQRSDLLLESDLPQVAITKLKGRGDLAMLRQKIVLPSVVVPILKRLLRILPADQKHVFCADDDHHLPSGGWCEKESRLKAEYLSDQLATALASSRWSRIARWHVFRHTLASQLLQQGYSQQEVKETIGWCSDEMAQRYQHLLQERKSQIINSVF